MNKFPIGLRVEYDGSEYSVIDWRDEDGTIVYDLEEVYGDGILNGIAEERLEEIVSNAVKIFVVTAFGAGIDTEVHLAKTEERAKDIANELFKDFNMDITDTEEMCYLCWRGYSKKVQCDVEIEVHEKMMP